VAAQDGGVGGRVAPAVGGSSSSRRKVTSPSTNVDVNAAIIGLMKSTNVDVNAVIKKMKVTEDQVRKTIKAELMDEVEAETKESYKNKKAMRTNQRKGILVME
ncbi:hypothetical protein B0T09DRAFT_265710, partial [Sordaria sp. MPI-SDFR-AT-0083]